VEEKKKKLSGQQGELMRVLDIVPDDLIANDEGYISERQQESVLKRQAYQWQGFFVVSILLGLFGLLFGGFAAFNTDKLLPLLAMTGFFLLIATFLGVASALYRQKVKGELQKNRFETTQGIAIVNVTEHQSQLEINGLKLDASPDVLRRVQHLQPYLIHYLPESKVILSMEHITESSNIRDDAATDRLQDTVDDTDYHSEQDNQQQSTSHL